MNWSKARSQGKKDGNGRDCSMRLRSGASLSPVSLPPSSVLNHHPSMVAKLEAPFFKKKKFLSDNVSLTHPMFSSVCLVLILLSLHLAKCGGDQVAVFWGSGYFI